MGHIFVSYSHKDKEYVHKLQEILQSEGFEVWIDDRIDFGDEWPMVIQEQLDACDVFILVASENAYRSKWVQKEVTRAQRINKPFFPILLSGDAWLSIESTQYADLRENKTLPEDFFKRINEYTERKFNETLVEVWITENWPAYINEVHKFMFRYPENGKITHKADSHVRIELPRLEGTNLSEKYLTIDWTNSEHCSPLTDYWYPNMVDMVQRRKVKINDLIFLKEMDSEGGAGSYLDRICYSISRSNLCVSITINMFFHAHGNYYPSLIPRLDWDTEMMIGTLVANTFAWLGD